MTSNSSCRWDWPQLITNILLQPLKCRDYRHESPCLILVYFWSWSCFFQLEKIIWENVFNLRQFPSRWMMKTVFWNYRGLQVSLNVCSDKTSSHFYRQCWRRKLGTAMPFPITVLSRILILITFSFCSPTLWWCQPGCFKSKKCHGATTLQV